MIFHLVSLLIFVISINAHEDFHAEPHIRQIPPWLPPLPPHIVQQQQHHPPHDDENNAANEIPVLNNNYLLDGGFSSTPPSPTPRHPPPIKLPFVNRPLQVTLLAVIMTAAIFANGSVIANISKDSLKLRMVHFLLIRHVCIADCLGAMVVLPVPLVAIVQGEWVFSENVCAAVSTTTASLWTMHLLAVALYRADRVLAVWLPTGRYPSFSVRTTNICLVLVWVVAITGAYGATWTFGHTFQPALALCIPNVPLVFFIIVFAGYCIGLVGLTTGYVLAFARRRRRKRKRERESKLYAELCNNAPFEPTPNDFIEDVESCGGTGERGRHRRALSDQYSDQYSASKAQMFTPSSKLTHRRVWSESAAAYVPTNLTSMIVTRSTQMSYDSSSFPQNSSDTNINDYDRLTEDDGSSDFSVRKLTHSVSFDGSTTSHQSQCQQQQAAGAAAAASMAGTGMVVPPSRKNFLFAQSKSFDQADIISSTKQQRNNMNNFNSMTMYESVVRSAATTTMNGSKKICMSSSKSGGGGHDGGGGGNHDDDDDDDDDDDKATFTSNIKKSSKSRLHHQNHHHNGGMEEDEEVGEQQHHRVSSVCCELDELDTHQRSQKYIDCAPENYTATNNSVVDTYPDNKMVPLSLYSWPLDNTVSVRGADGPNGGGGKRTTIGVIMETRSSTTIGESSDSLGVLDQRIPLQDTRHHQHHNVSSRIAKPQDFSFTVDPNAILSVNESSILGRTEGNNNTKTINFKGGSHGGGGGVRVDNNNVLQVRMVRKSRPRTRVKHFRPKGKTGPAKRAIASYAVSVGHLLLYLPAMFVVGLKGSTLPPGAALFCGLVVYCEFLVQPIALLLVSPRLRNEVSKTIHSFCVWCR